MPGKDLRANSSSPSSDVVWEANDITRTSPGVIAPVRTWLQIEELAIFILSLGPYRHYSFSWIWYVVLFLVPDLSMLGYVLGPRIGAMLYNIVHSYIGPVLLGLLGLTGQALCLRIALIWVGHIALDRALGYGLKYSTAFGDTHLGRVGKKS